MSYKGKWKNTLTGALRYPVSKQKHRYMNKAQQILKQPWFWINYLAILILTLPFSLLELTVNGKRVRSIPIWECYLTLLRGKIVTSTTVVILIHIIFPLILSFIIWILLFRPQKTHE